MKKVIMFLTILFSTPHLFAENGNMDLSKKILSALKDSMGVIDTDGYQTQVDDIQILDPYGMNGWMYVSMSIINTKEKKAEVPFRVITNGQFVIPMLGAILRTDTKENILEENSITKDIQLPEGGTILFGQKNAAHHITIFTDIFCDYCKNLKKDILEFVDAAGYSENDIVVSERYAPIGKDRMFVSQMYEVIRKMDINPSLKNDLLVYLSDSSILEHQTNADMLKAFLTQIEGMNIKEEFERLTKTDTRVAEDVIIASKIGVRGVPFTVINGKGFKGYNKDVLFNYLEKLDEQKGE